MRKITKFYLLTLTAAMLFFYPSLHLNAQEYDWQSSWFLEDISAPAAWESLSLEDLDFSQPVVVAVIDTGCDYTHPLLENSLWINVAEQNGLDDVDDDGNGYIDDIYGIDTFNNDSDPMDDSVGSILGHGTHVAGTILQTAGATLTDNPFNIRLMVIKAGDAYGNFHASDVAEALHYAVENGASVINMSISSTKAPSILKNALEYASDFAILVASAGNRALPTEDSSYTTSDDYFPAAYPFVVGVMSYGTDHVLSYFSNWDTQPYIGGEYEIAAPGEDITSASSSHGYKSMNGTSMASGIVSGAAALLYGKYRSSNFYSVKDLTAHIMESGNKIISHTDTYGKNHLFSALNLEELLSLAPAPRPVISDLTLEADETSPLSYILNYTVLNRGCTAYAPTLDMEWDMEGIELTLLSDPLPESLSALSEYNGQWLITFPEGTPGNTSAVLKLTLSSGDSVPYSLSHTLIIEDGTQPPAVTEIPLQGISVTPAFRLLLKPGEVRGLAVTFLPENTTDSRDVSFSSSRPEVASVDEYGIITAHQTGTSVISVLSSMGHVRTLTVIVYQNQIPPETESEIPPTESEITIPESETTASPDNTSTLKKGQLYVVNGMNYKLTKINGNIKTAALMGTKKTKASLKSLSIPDCITVKGVVFRVTAVGKNAFKNYKKLKAIRLGKYVQRLEAKSFFGCSKLKRLNFSSAKLKSIGKNAIKEISKKAAIILPKKRSVYYRKLLKKSTGYLPSMKLKTSA